MTRATVGADGETITVHVPLTFRKRVGRKRAYDSLEQLRKTLLVDWIEQRLLLR